MVLEPELFGVEELDDEALEDDDPLEDDPDEDADDFDELAGDDDEAVDDESVGDEVDESVDAAESPEPSPPPLDDEPEPSAVDPRLSVLKKPLPLNVTPTGWKTFFTAIVSPEAGCTYSVSVSSVNDCSISTVSPVSTNL